MKILKFIVYLLGDLLSSTFDLLKCLVTLVAFLSLSTAPVILVCYGAGRLFIWGLAMAPQDTATNIGAGVILLVFAGALGMLLTAVISVKRHIQNEWKHFHSKGQTK
jgi:hypothetical protein